MSIKKQTNLSELLFYLEEMYQMEMLDEIETDIYERYTYGDKMTKDEMKYVYNCMQEYMNEVF